MTERRKDLFKNTYRSSMALTIDYVFHAVFGRDTDESKAALMEILNISWNVRMIQSCQLC